MICAVYKSSLREETYLFIEKKGQFDDIPETLLKMFGTPQLLMLIPIDKREKLGFADIKKVKEEMRNNGYYLQIPPPKENLLDTHRRQLGVED